MKKKFFLSLFFVGLIVLIFSFVRSQASPAQSTEGIWQIQSADTMKYSRDAARDPQSLEEIPIIVKQVADLHANYIAIDTPYDEEFYPVLQAWVDEARFYHLRVWFRGNFSSWEGWFGYPSFTDISQHHVLTHAFILKHPELFQDGDIFTPVPEPENGGMGDPRGSDELAAQFNQFLIDSYNNCVKSFAAIHKNVACGYFSVNGDIAKQILTKRTVQQIGNAVVIDHYVDSPEQMQADISYLYNKLGAKIVLGEYGAPIPDINGDMTEKQQADFLNSLLYTLYQNRSIVTGLNYWVTTGSSTQLYNDNGTPRLAASVVKKYYTPTYIVGTITDTAGTPLEGVSLISAGGVVIASTDHSGYYSFPALPGIPVQFQVNKSLYIATNRVITPNADYKNIQDISLEPRDVDFAYKIRLFFNNLFKL